MKKTSNNFGAIGWYYIVLTAVLFMICAGLTTDTLNVTIDKFSQVKGWQNTTLLHYSTLAGYVSIAAAAFLSWQVSKRGTRFIMTITLFLCGIATIWWGRVDSPFQYFIACAIVVSCNNGYAHIASSNLAAVWYPTRKGLFLGWSTMGMQLSCVILVPLMNWLLNSMGISYAYLVFGIIQIVLGFVVWFTVRNTPEELGRFPDNIPVSPEEQARKQQEDAAYVSSWTVLDFLTNRQVWLISIPFGILYMTAVGMMSQWVPRLVSLGFPSDKAIFIMSVASLIGVVGSYVYGWLDMKFGVKKASVIIMFDFIIAMLLTVLPYHIVSLWASVILVGMGLGGVANLAASLTASIFGPREFAKAFSIVNPLMGIIRVAAMSVLAFGLTLFGTYNGAYVLFLILDVVAAVVICFVKEDRQLASSSQKAVR